MTSQDLSGFIGPPSSAAAGADPFSDLYNTTANKLNERIKQGAQGQGFFKLLLRMLLGRMAGGDSSDSEIKDLSYLFSHLTSIKQGREQIKAEKEARLEQIKVQGDMQKELVKLSAEMQAAHQKTQLAAENEAQHQRLAFERYKTDLANASNDKDRKAADERFKASTDLTKNLEERKMAFQQEELNVRKAEGAAERSLKKELQGETIKAQKDLQTGSIEAQKEMQGADLRSREKLQTQAISADANKQDKQGMYGVLQQFLDVNNRSNISNKELNARQSMQSKELGVKQAEGAADRASQEKIAGVRAEAGAKKQTPIQEKYQVIASGEGPNLINAFLGTSATNVQEGKIGAGEGPVAQLIKTFASPAYMQAYGEIADAKGEEVVDPMAALQKAGIDPDAEMKQYILQHRQQDAPLPSDPFGVPVEQGKQRMLQLVDSKKQSDPSYHGEAGNLLQKTASDAAKGIGQLQEVYRAAYNNVRLQASKTDTIKNQLEEDFRNLAPATTVERSPGSVGNDPKVRKWRQEFAIPEDETVFNPTQAEAILKKFRDTVQKDPTYGMRFQKYLQTKK